MVKTTAFKYTATVYTYFLWMPICYHLLFLPMLWSKLEHQERYCGEWIFIHTRTSNTFCRTFMCAGVQMCKIATNFCTATLSHTHFYTQLQKHLLTHSKFEKGNSFLSKAHIFWEGLKILWNLHLTFVICSASQN